MSLEWKFQGKRYIKGKINLNTLLRVKMENLGR